MNLLRVLLAILVVTFAGAAFGQSGERGSIPPGESKDGSRPSDGAIQGGTILPGETGGIPDGTPQTPASERVARCHELQGTLRQECLAQENRAGAGGTKGPEARETQPSPPVTAPPQNPLQR
jgi:hypothetical protein